VSRLLFLIGSTLFATLGLAHGLLTLRDLRTPRAFTPVDDHVRVAMIEARLRLAPQTTMWSAWLGFNLSHGLGLAIFGGLLTALALGDFELIEESSLLKASAIVVAVLYFLMAIRFWFWVPAIVSAIGAVCFLAAALGS
jgi:hypothetical protein